MAKPMPTTTSAFIPTPRQRGGRKISLMSNIHAHETRRRTLQNPLQASSGNVVCQGAGQLDAAVKRHAN
jgi:hypothetical protein